MLSGYISLSESIIEATTYMYPCPMTVFLQKSLTSEDGGATRTLELDTEKDKDSRAIFERSQALSKVSHCWVSLVHLHVCECVSVGGWVGV